MKHQRRSARDKIKGVFGKIGAAADVVKQLDEAPKQPQHDRARIQKIINKANVPSNKQQRMWGLINKLRDLKGE